MGSFSCSVFDRMVPEIRRQAERRWRAVIG
jgi:hypothetical protein